MHILRQHSVLEVFKNGSNIDVRFARSLPNLNISVAYTFRDLRLHAIRLNDTCNGQPTTLMRFKHVHSDVCYFAVYFFDREADPYSAKKICKVQRIAKSIIYT